jgi:hypothetical protein
VNVLAPGSLVRITSYSPFRSLQGTIRIVDTISAELEEPFCFYLTALPGTQSKESMWFAYDEVEALAAPCVPLSLSPHSSARAASVSWKEEGNAT